MTDTQLQDPVAAHFKLKKAERAKQMVRLRNAVRALFADRTLCLYSVELAQRMDCSNSRAKQALSDLEQEGRLVSEKRQSPKSGLGRRYYRAV